MMTLIYIALTIIVIFLIIVAFLPGDFRIERSTAISAPPPVVFDLVNDFHKWTAWSPWDKLDPNLVRTYAGSPSGAGAIYSWAGNNKVGEGRMTLMDSQPSSLIRIKLEFLKPFQATNTAEFAFVPQGSQTRVTWSMTGTKNFILKLFGLFMSMDKLVGKDFEKGLAQMKASAEAG